MQCDSFLCPYSKKALTRPCEVGSCTYNLSPASNLSLAYQRCFLKYLKETTHNPFKIESVEAMEFARLPIKYREQIVQIFFPEEASCQGLRRATSSFYVTLFSILAQEATAAVSRSELDPVPFEQCAVCGQSHDDLWFPTPGTTPLPEGWGYCSWGCYQKKPPLVLSLEAGMEVEFDSLLLNFSFDLIKSRPKFLAQLTAWVLPPPGPGENLCFGYENWSPE